MSGILVALPVAASPDRAFVVFTREIGVWWRSNTLFRFTLRSRGPSAGVVSFEAGIGGRFIATFADGEIFEIGRVTHWEPGARLDFRWRQHSFGPAEITRVSARFEPMDGGTRVTVEHLGWDTVPDAHVARHGFPDHHFLRRHAEWRQALLASRGRRLTG